MSVISRYLTKEALKYICIVMGTVVSIYVAVDFFEKTDNFLEAGLPLSRIVTFLIFKTPFIIAQIMPVCVLLAVLIVLGLMNRNNEILALRSSGVSVWQLFKPILSIGIVFSLILFFFAEAVVPITVERANQIWLKEVKNRSGVVSREKNIWFRDTGLIIHIRYYDKIEKAVLGLTIYHFDKNFRLNRRIDAQKGVFISRDMNRPEIGEWLLSGLIEQRLDKSGDHYHVICDEERIGHIGLLPENLETVIKKSEEMNFRELLAYIRKIKDEGYDATAYRVDLHAKIAFPFVCVILCLVGAGISLKEDKKESLAITVVYGICISFLYWVFYSFCISLGYGEMLPPVIAAWTSNVLFLCFGVFNLLNCQ